VERRVEYVVLSISLIGSGSFKRAGNKDLSGVVSNANVRLLDLAKVGEVVIKGVIN
jgi:hypothetical protein